MQDESTRRFAAEQTRRFVATLLRNRRAGGRNLFAFTAVKSGAGVTRLSLDYQIPIANAIITTENLEHHAWLRGLTRTADETDGALLARLLDGLPPDAALTRGAGGWCCCWSVSAWHFCCKARSTVAIR